MDAMQTKQQDTVVLECAQETLLPNTLEIQLKAERVQEPASLQEQQPAEAFLYGLSIQPVQPVSITLAGTSVGITLYGPGGGASPGEAS